jgi:RNA polymerase sigma factor (sigma-70 family)
MDRDYYLAHLNPENRELVQWWIEDLDAAEIAQRLGISRGAVRTRISRAIAELRTIAKASKGREERS